MMKNKALLEAWEKAQAEQPRLCYAEFAAQIGLSVRVLRARLDDARVERKHNDFSLGQPWELSGDWMICGDVHIPFADWDWCANLRQIAEKYMPEPRRLLIAGDFFNLDSFSRWPHLIQIPGWPEERQAAHDTLAGWLSTFAEIRLLAGNHERRLQAFTAGAFDETDILALVISNPERVKMSPFGWCTIDTPAGPWRVTHPKNYSVNQLVVADTMAQKYQAHILAFHEHHLSLGFDRYKRYLLVNGGCLAEPNKLAYVTLDDSKAAGMAKGFVMLRNGVPYLFGDGLTDWSLWLGK